MDYSVTNAMQSAPGLQRFLIVYDVVCQWAVNFFKRVQANPGHLKLPTTNLIQYAVGKFHLGAHIKSCFSKHTLNFVEGAGMLDGEVIETLWVQVNSVAGMTRSMSRAHRSEFLDDIMNDSNWKKTLLIGELALPLPLLQLQL